MSFNGAAPYPQAQIVDVALRDGSTVCVRPVGAEDRPAIVDFLGGLSPQSIAFRFFGQVDLGWAADWSLDVDYADRYALVASAGLEHTIIAHGAYVRTGHDQAEVAFTVADEWQGRGIATVMLAHLAEAAEQHGISMFSAQVLPGNHHMISVFRDSGFPVSLRSSEGVVEVEFPTSRSQQTRERFEQREHTAAVAAIQRFMQPRVVAVIGASPRRSTVGGEILRNLRDYGFRGLVYAVNRRVRTIAGQKAYPSIGEIPEIVDLAVVAVPAAQVCDVAANAAQPAPRRCS